MLGRFYKNDVYHPNYWQILVLSIKAGHYNRSMLKWLGVILCIIFSALIMTSQIGHKLLTQNRAIINDIKRISIILGISKPAPANNKENKNQDVRVNAEGLRMLEPVAKLYLDFSGTRKPNRDKSQNGHWVLQGLADDITKNPENRKIIKKWIHSIKYGNKDPRQQVR